MGEKPAPQMLSAWVRRSLEEVSAFATDEVLAAFQDAAGDQVKWENAKRDPKGLLKSRGIEIPETLEILFDDQPANGPQAARRCLRVCRNEPPPDPGTPPIVWCYNICLL